MAYRYGGDGGSGGGGSGGGGSVSPHGGAGGGGGGTSGGTFISSGSEAGAAVIIFAYSAIATGDAPGGVDVTGRRPATPTTGQEAEKLQHVVYRMVGAAVELVVVPARVSEIMGAISAAGPRLAVVHTARHGARAPRVAGDRPRQGAGAMLHCRF